MSSYLSYFSRDPSSSFAYEIGTEITGLDSSQSIWAIHEGKLKKAPHTKVTVFVYDVKVSEKVSHVNLEFTSKNFANLQRM